VTALLLFGPAEAGHYDRGLRPDTTTKGLKPDITTQEGRTVSENSKMGKSVEPDEPHEPPEALDEVDDCLQLILDADDQTPEEAGYGHGV
jgi:hypothetical protein